MSKQNKKYVQCKLQRVAGHITFQTTSWIPTNIAEVGKQVKLKEARGWSFWTVLKRGNKELSYSDARSLETKWKNFKKVFD